MVLCFADHQVSLFYFGNDLSNNTIKGEYHEWLKIWKTKLYNYIAIIKTQLSHFSLRIIQLYQKINIPEEHKEKIKPKKLFNTRKKCFNNVRLKISLIYKVL